MSGEWRANSMELHFTDQGHDFVGFHNQSLATVVADRHNQVVDELRRVFDEAMDELGRHQEATSAAARVLVQKDDQIGILETQLGQAHELLRTLEAARKADNIHALDELARMQLRLDQAILRTGYLQGLMKHLRTAAQQAATLLFNLDQRGGLGFDVHRSISDTAAALEVMLAATKEGGSDAPLHPGH